jgi:hypothetical protein
MIWVVWQLLHIYIYRLHVCAVKQVGLVHVLGP